MNSKVKQCISILSAMLLTVLCILPVGTVRATEVQQLQQATSALEGESQALSAELEETMEEISELTDKIADAEIELEDISNDIEKTEEQLKIAANSEKEQYESMKSRIKYLYENGSTSFVSMILEAKSMTDFLNKVDFVTNISEYDRDQLDQLIALEETIQEQNDYLVAQKDEQQKAIKKLNKEKKELKAKADETELDIDLINAQIETLKVELRAAEEAEYFRQLAIAQAAAEAEAAQQQAQLQASVSQQQTTQPTQQTTQQQVTQPTQQQITQQATTPPSYNYGTSGGALTPSKGVVYYGGHRETYYSQRVLPGGGLNIPGRHVAADGTIRDADGYIVVASSDHSKGTMIETSLGAAKVYDCGCDSGTIDIYTDW